ncbi:MAG: hypothetical protein R3281_06430 [Balneolaceae bacterium]|nr:hypothetical protein [Balneolaceae bacterium]
MKNLTLNISNIVLAGLVLSVLCSGVTIPGYAQEQPINDMIKSGVERGIDESMLAELKTRSESRGITQQQLRNILASALELASDNLPSEHIIQKALEGMSKGVPDTRIASVIDRMNQSTRHASQVIDPWMELPRVRQMVNRSGPSGQQTRVRNQMIEASARAITQDVPAESIGRMLEDLNNDVIMDNSSPSDIAAAINILPDLSAGQQPDMARGVVVRALKGGFKGADLQKLPMAVNMAQQRSQIPAAAVLQGVSKQLQAGTPAAQVLQNLFNGTIGGGPPGNSPRGLQDNPGQGNRGQGQGQGQGRGNN